jgi:hypothetical protein
VIVVKFNLEVQLLIEGTAMLSRGSFFAKNRMEVPFVVFQFIQKLKRETGYRTTIIQKVMVDGSKDITKEVIEIDSRPIPPMEDIFW